MCKHILLPTDGSDPSNQSIASAVELVAAVGAEEGNLRHVGAPTPRMVVTVAVKPGQKVSAGDALLSIEAMKMETMLRAECDGTVAEMHVKPGTLVAPKDLLLSMAG